MYACKTCGHISTEPVWCCGELLTTLAERELSAQQPPPSKRRKALTQLAQTMFGASIFTIICTLFFIAMSQTILFILFFLPTCIFFYAAGQGLLALAEILERLEHLEHKLPKSDVLRP